MLKDPIPGSELQLQAVLTTLQHLMEHATQTGESTASIQVTVEELKPLLALLARPEAQELEMGQRLEQTLAGIWDRLGAIETSMTQSTAWQKEHDKRLAQLEVRQEQLSSDLSQLIGDLFAEEDLAGQ